ncbi:SDR family oxidoreductase [Streptomyces sp. NPDC005727]|uniref:SDR family oxidoreductase n=1 Tax=unclassified Streptomyces TaxID=2593676 RepID=UPI0033EB8988
MQVVHAAQTVRTGGFQQPAGGAEGAVHRGQVRRRAESRRHPQVTDLRLLLGSVAGLRAATDSPAYDSSKAGLFGLTRHVAKAGGPRGIRANLVVPGLIDTPMGRQASTRRASRSASFGRIPLGRQGTAWAVAAAVTFPLSDRASCITGQSLVVDGGLNAV